MVFSYNKKYELQKNGDTFLINDHNIELLKQMLNIDPTHQGVFTDPTHQDIFLANEGSMVDISEQEFKVTMVDILEQEFKIEKKDFSKKNDVSDLFKIINKENSTRLSNDEIDAYADFFSDNFKTNLNIDEKIKNPTVSVVEEILQQTQEKQKDKQIKIRYNLSFISKVICFIWYYCYSNKESGSEGFSIFDRVVKTNLVRYMNPKTLANYQKILNSETKNVDYKEYNRIIGEILDDVNKTLSPQNRLNRREFDFFIYYLYR